MTGASQALRCRLVALALGSGLGPMGCSVETTAQELACYDTADADEQCLDRDKAADRLPTIGEGVCNQFKVVSVEDGPVEQLVEARGQGPGVWRRCCYLANYDLGSSTDICLGGRPLLISARPRHATLERGRGWV